MRKLQDEPISNFTLVILSIIALIIVTLFITGMPGRTASNAQTASIAADCQAICTNLASTGRLEGTNCCMINELTQARDYTNSCLDAQCMIIINGAQCIISTLTKCACSCASQKPFNCDTSNTNECCNQARKTYTNYTSACTQACDIPIMINGTINSSCTIP